MRVQTKMALRFDLLVLAIALLASPVLSDLILSKVDRRIDLTSQIVRITSTLKVENEGSESVTEVLLAFPDLQGKDLAFLKASSHEGKGKVKSSAVSLPVENVKPNGMPAALTFYAVKLPKALGKGDNYAFDVLTVFTHALRPFPEKITQADIQLVVFQDSAHFLTPYVVKVQSLSIKLPEARIESYTKLENTKIHGSEIKYGPYENLPSFSYLPIVVHFESNQPFAVAQELVREIEISHWGNVQVTEHYNLVHGGAQSKGEFSRLDYQARPNIRGASAFKYLIAKLPPRAHSVYYRDEIGNISTSNLWGDSKKTELLIEPRYPLFGGWRTAFTIGYGLPLKDFLFESEGKRFLNITFGSPMNELIIDNLFVKTKLSHLDIAGRPVVVLQKTNVVPEHYQNFQVYYKFCRLLMLREPLMLIFGFFSLFVAGNMHVDMSISKAFASYLARLQWDEVQAAIQQAGNIMNRCLTTDDKLEASFRDLSRTWDVQACNTARKAADGLLKKLLKELKHVL